MILGIMPKLGSLGKNSCSINVKVPPSLYLQLFASVHNYRCISNCIYTLYIGRTRMIIYILYIYYCCISNCVYIYIYIHYRAYSHNLAAIIQLSIGVRASSCQSGASGVSAPDSACQIGPIHNPRLLCWSRLTRLMGKHDRRIQKTYVLGKSRIFNFLERIRRR